MIKLKTMKDRQKIFLNKVTKLLVDDTILDYDEGDIHFLHLPKLFLPLLTLLNFHYLSSHSPLNHSIFYSFSKYCKDNYGLNDGETEYVWDQYKSIIRNKINNNER